MNIIATEQALDELVQSYLDADFAFDVETVGDDRLNFHTNQVTWLAMATHGRVDVIPMGHPNGEFIRWDKPLLANGRKRQEQGKELREQDYSQVQSKWTPVFTEPPKQLLPSQVWEALRPVFSNPETTKVAHNLKFDVKAVAKYLGFVVAGQYWDTMIAGWVIEPSNAKGLDDMLARTFGYKMVKGIGKMVEVHSFSDVAKYAALDARWTWLLANRQATLLEERKVGDIFDLEMDTLKVVIDMEMHGVRLDTEALYPLRDRLESQLNEDTLRVYEAAGKEFNLNSNADKVRILFGRKDEGNQGLKPVKGTASGNPSVDAKVLKALSKNKVAAALLQYAATKKLLSTYVTAYTGGEVERTTNGKTHMVVVPSLLQGGRVYGTFNQTGAETGRFSSSNPNLQNVPNASTDNGRAIRNLFLPDEGHRFIVADFSQIEPRIIASLSKDKRMLEAFNTGQDVYLMVSEPLGVKRAVGKELVLSIAYGIGPDTIAERVGIKVSEARKLMDDFTKEFRSIETLRRMVITRARNQNPPHVRTVYNRIRIIPDLRSAETWVRARAERQAFNTLIQGCLPADTCVLTKGGWTPIGDFEDGTEVWTGERWASAVRVYRGPDTRVRLHLSDGRTFDCDTRHKLLVNDSVWPRWAHLDEVIGLTTAGSPLPLVRDTVTEFGVPDGDTEDWYWLGRMIGDGHTASESATNKVWSLAFGPSESEDLQNFTDWLDRNSEHFVGGTNSTTGYHVQRGRQVVGGTRKGFEYWTTRGVVGGSRGKRIPSKVFTLDLESRQAFFDGYFAADGHTGDRSRKITSVNLELLRDTLRLMQTIGMHGRISGPMTNSEGVEWYDLYLHSTPTELFVEKFEFLDREPMYTLAVNDERHAYSSEGLISKNTAADVMKKALVRTHSLLPHGSHIVLTVHDELVVSAPEDDVEVAAKAVREGMTGIEDFAVPLEIDLKVVDRWGDAK